MNPEQTLLARYLLGRREYIMKRCHMVGMIIYVQIFGGLHCRNLGWQKKSKKIGVILDNS